MASDRPTIDVQKREQFGSRVTRRLRKSGKVPGVVYGGAEGSNVSFEADARELRRVLIGSGALIDLKVDGTARPVILKDMQQHPVRGDLMHVDFVEVRLDQAIQTTVALHAIGGEEAPGVKEGGVLELPTHQLNIEALPTAIPDEITIDVSGLGIAETMHLSAVTAPEGVTFLDDPEETIVATIVIPSEEPEEPELEEEAGVVGEDGEPSGRRAPTRRRGQKLPVEAFRGRLRGVLSFLRGAIHADWLIVGLGNPGPRYAGTRHNVGFAVLAELAKRWDMPRAKDKYKGRFTVGRTGPGGPHVALLEPQTFMNDSGQSVGPARGALPPGSRPRGRDPRRDRPAVRAHRVADRWRARGPQRAEVAEAGAGLGGLQARARGGGAAGHDRPGDRLRACAGTLRASRRPTCRT